MLAAGIGIRLEQTLGWVPSRPLWDYPAASMLREVLYCLTRLEKIPCFLLLAGFTIYAPALGVLTTAYVGWLGGDLLCRCLATAYPLWIRLTGAGAAGSLILMTAWLSGAGAVNRSGMRTVIPRSGAILRQPSCRRLIAVFTVTAVWIGALCCLLVCYLQYFPL